MPSRHRPGLMRITVSHSLAVKSYSCVHVCVYTSLHPSGSFFALPPRLPGPGVLPHQPAGQSHEAFCLLLHLGGHGENNSATHPQGLMLLQIFSLHFKLDYSFICPSLASFRFSLGAVPKLNCFPVVSFPILRLLFV